MRFVFRMYLKLEMNLKRMSGRNKLFVLLLLVQECMTKTLEKISDDFQSYCPNVTSLSIEYENDENYGNGVWVSSFGCQLEKLEIITEESSL